MNLNLNDDVVIISSTTSKIRKQIKFVLAQEGVTNVLDCSTDVTSSISRKETKICAIVTIKESNHTFICDELLHTLRGAQNLTDPLTIINIGTLRTLGIQNNQNEDNTAKSDTNLKQLLKVNTITLIFPEEKKLLKNNSLKSKVFCKTTTNSRNEQIANTVAFLISKKSVFNNGQVIFIDNGFHLLEETN